MTSPIIPARWPISTGRRPRIPTPEQSAATRRELFSRFADTPTLVIGGHFNAGHIKREGDAFKFIALG